MFRLAASAFLIVPLLAGVASAATGPAADTTMPPFPTSHEDAAVILWLHRNTTLGEGRSVVFGPDNVLVLNLDEVDPKAPAVHHVDFRQEAVRVDFVSRTGGRSLHGIADVDCANRTVRATSVVLYSGTDLRGDQVVHQGPDPAWRAPVSGTASAIVVGEVCSPHAARPLPPPAPEPAPEPEPQPLPPPRPAPPPPPPAPTPAPTPAPVARRTVGEPGVLVQIGAYGTRAQAEGAWSQLAEQMPGGLTGKRLRIEPVPSPEGGTLFRTSIEGFASDAAARGFCADLIAKGHPCFVRKAP